jgi:hypothetical protein
MVEQARILGRVGIAIGWLAATGCALVIVELVEILTFAPAEWWRPLASDPSTGQLDLRATGIICPGPIGWTGGWGYFVGLLRLPYTAWRAVRGARVGLHLTRHEWLLLALVTLLTCCVQVLFRGTPLRYEYPLF